uniref:Uncharacterized protein n=1 Tax=Globisporangium ultimum (strain ATCC 200006 / CBS 805.95 / DAOM BR144) TaxID=431595 RepID=K3WIR4_GLOUD
MPSKPAIVAVDAVLLADAVDEDESDAVALLCVEWLLAETNAAYEQHRLATRAVTSLAQHIVGSIFDAVGAAMAPHEEQLDDARFTTESAPVASGLDRHAVRSLPQRDRLAPVDDSQEARGKSHDGEMLQPLSPLPRASSSSEKTGVARASRRKAPERVAPLTLLPDIRELPDDTDERPDVKAWRSHCLQELSISAKRKRSVLRWATVARAFASTTEQHKMSMEVEIVEAAPLRFQKEIVDATPKDLALKLKSNGATGT